VEAAYSQACQSLKALMDCAVNYSEVVMLRRRHGVDVALVSADELAGLLETAHLLRSPLNTARLLGALNRARTAPLPPMDLDDLEAILTAEPLPPGHGC
jgi:antitoxin YefM